MVDKNYYHQLPSMDLLPSMVNQWENGGFLKMKGTPSHHPFLDGIFP